MPEPLSQEEIDKMLNAISESAEDVSPDEPSSPGIPFFGEENVRNLPLSSSILFPGEIISGEVISGKKSVGTRDPKPTPSIRSFLNGPEEGTFLVGGCEYGRVSAGPRGVEDSKIIIQKPAAGKRDKADREKTAHTGEICMTLSVHLGTVTISGTRNSDISPGTVIPVQRWAPGEPVTVAVNGYPLCRAEVLAAGDDFAVRLTGKAEGERVSSGPEGGEEASVILGTIDVTMEEIRSFTEGTIMILDRSSTDPVDVEYRGDVLFQGFVVPAEEGFAVRVTGTPESAGSLARGFSKTNKEDTAISVRTLSGPRFSFITREDTPELLTILRNETGDLIALVLSYLEPDFAGKIFSQLEQEQQIEAGRIIAEGRAVDSSLAEEVETELYTLLRG